MPKEMITAEKLAEHVCRVGEEQPPIDLDSADLAVRDAPALRTRYGRASA